jgi:starch synthase (maltosyl-transferring)
MIGRVKRDFPDVIFLSEAFTRPRIMEQLSKVGFTHSYTYFTWRNSKWELETYLRELTESDVREYFRPNFWPNTPDILHETLQHGGRPAFISRFLLASTLSTNYGIYGPAFELCVNTPREPGSEEYLDSEKYEVKHWDLWGQHSIRDVIAHVNRARRENPALQHNGRLRFLDIDSEQIIAYVKASPDNANRVLVLVNLDAEAGQSGTLWLPLEDLGLPWHEDFAVDDLLRDGTESWRGDRQVISLHPSDTQVRLLRLRPHS